ncbi:alpha/beta-hydrolase family protein [Nocardia jinanensis]|uniref:Membrane protein n=1 Tax=Nocardia jinanensis TaxID=382504 RepID=A0A917VWV0_9NOCA|nr:alpha/beta-hydrolase family protein [Nocardia jinanensis]GGL38455.1 membrane protein [Nocardia jinanensis]
MSEIVTSTRPGPVPARHRLRIRLTGSLRALLPRYRPPVATTLAVAAGTAVSLAPGLLPRTAAAQSVLTALMVALALCLVQFARFVVRHITGHIPARTERTRRVVYAAAAAGVLGAVVYAELWQHTLRIAMDVAPTGPGYWLSWAFGATLLTTVIVTAVRGCGRLLRRIGWSRTLVMAVVAGLPLALFAVPAAVSWGDRTYAAANAAADPGLVRPVTVSRSGSAESMVSWSTLGREGQRFVTGGPPSGVQVYVGLRSAPDLASRAALAVRELERAGGFDRAHLVVAVPTGSGWVDARALRGFGARFNGDVAVVALQYSYAPSWVTFLFGRDAATASARALFTAVEQRIATMEDPPRLHLYGQSLGALGGSAVFAGAAEQNRRVCSALWAGMPGGGGPEPGARTTVLANTSDPVVHWSLDLLWRPPDLTATHRDAPTPPWLPVVSFLQTTADLLGSLGAPPGHGHRYDTDQGTALPGCDPV